MAYIEKEQVKQIRESIKKEFPKYKFSITRQHGSSVNVHLMKADFEVEENYMDINHYYLENYSDQVKSVFTKISDIINNVKECYNRNAGDMGADYSDMTFFINFAIGKWNNPYQTI